MDLTKALNSAADEDYEFVRTRDFIIGEKYKIHQFGTIKTKYGLKIVTILDKETYFLPPRYARVVKQWAENIESIDCQKMFLVLEGHRSDEFKSPILKFITETE